MRLRTFCGLFAPFICFSLSTPVFGAGIWLYEKGTPEVGTAHAGAGSRAGDASTAMLNPAGMTRLEKPQLMATLQPTILDIQFEPDSQTTITGSSGDASDFIPAGGFFYVHPIGEKWRLGFSLASYFGLGAEYEDDWVGRYYIQESNFLTVSATPSLAYKVNEWLSIGGGVGATFASFDSRAAVRNLLRSDGQLKFEDTDTGIGGLISVLIEPKKGTRFGLGYTTPVKLEFEDTIEFTGLSNFTQAFLKALGLLDAEVGVEITIPQTVMFSFFHEFNDTWAIMGNIGWQDWSEFGQVPVSIRSTTSATVTQDRNFDDTWHFALGAHYRFHPRWRVTAGISHDTSPVSDEYRTPDLPLDRTWRYSGGLIHEFGEKATLGLAYTFLDAGDGAINQTQGPLSGILSGKYSSNYVHIIAINLNYTF